MKNVNFQNLTIQIIIQAANNLQMRLQTELETTIKLFLAKKNFLVNRQTVTKFRNQKTNCKANMFNEKMNTIIA